MTSAEQWRSGLAVHPYGFNASDFVRFRADANDDAVGSIVRSVTADGWGGANELRRALSADEAETLRLYGLRRVVQGRRQASLGALYEAIDTFALLPRVDDVPWESWFKGDLFIARTLGGDLSSFAARFVDLADERATKRSNVAIESMSRVESLEQCHLVEVATNYGTGYVENLVFRDTSSAGFFGTLRLGDNLVAFRPSTNLAQLAASLADALDATRRVVTGPVGQDQLAGALFSLVVAGGYVPCAGCLSFVADGLNHEPSFAAFVAELPDESDVVSMVASANEIAGQTAVGDGRRLVVLTAQPSFDAADEDTDVDLHSFDETLRTSFAGIAGDWKPH